MNRSLKIAILDSGFKSYQVANQAGILETRLSRLVSQAVNATEVEKKKIASVLKVPISKIF